MAITMITLTQPAITTTITNKHEWCKPRRPAEKFPGWQWTSKSPDCFAPFEGRWCLVAPFASRWDPLNIVVLDIFRNSSPKKCLQSQVQMMSHFTCALFSFTDVESFCHVDVVHWAVKGTTVEDLPLDQRGALMDEDDDGDVDGARMMRGDERVMRGDERRIREWWEEDERIMRGD